MTFSIATTDSHPLRGADAIAISNYTMNELNEIIGDAAFGVMMSTGKVVVASPTRRNVKRTVTYVDVKRAVRAFA